MHEKTTPTMTALFCLDTHLTAEAAKRHMRRLAINEWETHGAAIMCDSQHGCEG
jgi:hypothetical protein